MGAVAVALVGVVVGGVLFVVLAMMGRRPTGLELAVVAALGVAVGVLWVRPWEEGPPTSKG